VGVLLFADVCVAILQYVWNDTGCPLQRLFSMFPNGWPGRGLLLLRIANGSFIIHQGVVQLSASQHSSAIVAACGASVAAGALLMLGIWTPIVASFLAILEIGMLMLGTGRSMDTIFCAVIALALAMLGPGVWSVDAAIFGRQRLEFPNE
jgi:putative oxidoreductase